MESVGVGSPNPSGGGTPPLRLIPCLEFWRTGAGGRHDGACLLLLPSIAGDGDCPCVAGDEDEGTSPGDGDISGIARSADQFELSVICEDDHRAVAADPLEREQVADAG